MQTLALSPLSWTAHPFFLSLSSFPLRPISLSLSFLLFYTQQKTKASSFSLLGSSTSLSFPSHSSSSSFVSRTFKEERRVAPPLLSWDCFAGSIFFLPPSPAPFVFQVCSACVSVGMSKEDDIKFLKIQVLFTWGFVSVIYSYSNCPLIFSSLFLLHK